MYKKVATYSRHCIFKKMLSEATTLLQRAACCSLFSAKSYETACNTDKDYIEWEWTIVLFPSTSLSVNPMAAWGPRFHEEAFIFSEEFSS